MNCPTGWSKSECSLAGTRLALFAIGRTGSLDPALLGPRRTTISLKRQPIRSNIPDFGAARPIQLDFLVCPQLVDASTGNRPPLQLAPLIALYMSLGCRLRAYTGAIA